MTSPAADSAFAAGLYRALAAGPGGLVFSPASIAAALRLALPGARGGTAAELAALLHAGKPAEAGEGPTLPGELRAESTGPGPAGEDPGLIYRAPNTVWVQRGLPLRPEYTDAVTALAAEALHAADFAAAPDQARSDINAVIAGQTAGKIAALLAPGTIGPQTRLVLASAVYLRAAWAHPFPAGATRDAPFHPAPGQERAVPVMHLTARLGYLRGEGYQAVTLPYRGGRLVMTVVLPDGAPGDFGPVTGRLAASGLAGLLAGAGPRQVRLAVPRFRLETQLGLVPVLRQLGLELAFGERADFSGITQASRLSIDAVAHQACIDVDEEGTEAAAATGTMMAAMAVVREQAAEVTVDRPFLFAITDTVTGLPLFLGRVTDPAIR